jgi:hypothetical protein
MGILAVPFLGAWIWILSAVWSCITCPPPKVALAKSPNLVDEYLRLGWTLADEFREVSQPDQVEYFFEWRGPGKPVHPDRRKFRDELVED